MDCHEAQEQILEAIDVSRTNGDSLGLERHLAECEGCREFFAVQRNLDRRLTASITSPTLSPNFRDSLAKNVRREPLAAWPEFLPDLAHIAGCVFAIALCLTILPFPPTTVIAAGGAIAFATYFLQSVIRSLFEIDESRVPHL
jgi:predicted anti-sigma-YlaC factor YlaD